MTEHAITPVDSAQATLVHSDYWPIHAAKLLEEKKYSGVVQLCKEQLVNEPTLLSGRLIYAKALFYAGQKELASQQFYEVISHDPDNLVALKYLADISFENGDEWTAFANYQRILEIDPDTEGLRSDIRPHKIGTTRTIILNRTSEPVVNKPVSLRPVIFFTETIGDLYMSQGYPRLAAEVYKHLQGTSDNPRLAVKLATAEETIRERES
ncbi:MAG: hypothetical protein SGI97_06965 [candidate division Zixibacteria bacterium]|nr:hypothetical protein [candidate division Zixibacteria bacterium]